MILLVKAIYNLHLGNAFIQSGFVDEALKYINKSLDYNPKNFYSPLVKTYILYARDRDLDDTKQRLVSEYGKDSTRLDILQEVAKICYFQKDYDAAYSYYKTFADARKKYNLDMYPQEDLKIAWVYKKQGMEDEAMAFFNSYAAYCEKDESIYKSASLSSKYVYEGDLDKAMEQLKIFSTQNDFQYWILVFMEIDPIVEPLKGHPEFEAVMRQIKEQFWEDHDQIKESLKEKGLL